jgi:sortase A
VGVVALLAGLGLLGWAAWQYLGTALASNHQMDQAERHLREQWKTPGVTTRTAGTPLVLLRIPRFGEDWQKPVVEGVGKDDLSRGIGHYPGTQLPGEPGNFAVAGHRVTHGSPFRKLLDLRKGDQVIVETATVVYTYELDNSPRDLTVTPTDTWVLEPLPGKTGQAATKSVITLTTCQDLFRSPDRSVAFGRLTRVEKKG